jgi:hypothetical protein
VAPKKQRSSSQNPPKAKHVTDADALAMKEGVYFHEELANIGYSQRDEALLTSQKLAAYHAQKGHNKIEADDEEEEDDDDDDEEQEDDELEEDGDEDSEESEESQAEDEEAGRPRRLASSDPRKPTQDALLDKLLGPDADSSHPDGNFLARYENCTLASLYCIY